MNCVSMGTDCVYRCVVSAVRFYHVTERDVSIMEYDLFQQEPGMYISLIVISLVITILAYGTFPVILSWTRKRVITKKRYNFLCYGVNFLVMILFIWANGEASGGPYLLWTWIFTRSGLKKLESRGMLDRHQNECGNGEHNEKTNASSISADVTFSNIPAKESFCVEKIMNAKDPVKALMEEQAKETIRVMEENCVDQPNNEADPEFGLVPEKPIYTLAIDTVDGQRAYLGKLRTVNGEKISWKRLGSTSAEGIHGMIDIYETFLPSEKPYKTIYINMYGAKKSVSAPQGFVINDCAPETLSKVVQTANAKTVPVQLSATSSRPISRAGLWIIIILLIIALGVSLVFNYNQYLQAISSQSQVAELLTQVTELQKAEENSKNYKELLSAMQNVNGSNYTTIETLLDNLPVGYEDTEKIRTQYNEIKKYIDAIESSTYTIRSCDSLRTAYANLYSFNGKYHNWDISDYLHDGIYQKHFKKLIFGREWSDGSYRLYWYEDKDGERLVTNFPSNRRSGEDYYFITSGNASNFIIGYTNKQDSSDTFNTLEITDVIYSNGEWSISVYCYADRRTYTLR